MVGSSPVEKSDRILDYCLQAAFDVIKFRFHQYNYTGMMIEKQSSGYLEISHTADWALKVWAPDLSGLLEQAAYGMYALLQIQLQPGGRYECPLDLEAEDAESLLVSFLSELLYLTEQECLGFDAFDLAIEGFHLSGRMIGAPVESQRKEIKAVTYHNLAIQTSQQGLETTIVFDV